MLYFKLWDISAVSDEAFLLLKQKIYPFFADKKSLKRKDSVCAKALLCDILKEKFRLTDFTVECDEKGKPYIKNSPVHFNLSHSDNLVLCLCGNEKVGCDIQHIKNYNEKIVKRFFTCYEYDKLTESDTKSLDFTRLWALKESILKYYGDGIPGGLDSFDFSDCFKNEAISAHGLKFRVIEGEDYVISICSSSDEIEF